MLINTSLIQIQALTRSHAFTLTRLLLEVAINARVMSFGTRGGDT